MDVMSLDALWDDEGYALMDDSPSRAYLHGYAFFFREDTWDQFEEKRSIKERGLTLTNYLDDFLMGYLDAKGDNGS